MSKYSSFSNYINQAISTNTFWHNFFLVETMPLWRIYTNPSTFNYEQKAGLAKAVTKLYVDLPQALPLPKLLLDLFRPSMSLSASKTTR
jgi:hypothetical protein